MAAARARALTLAPRQPAQQTAEGQMSQPESGQGGEPRR